MTRRSFLLSSIAAPLSIPLAAAAKYTTLALTDVSVIDAAGLRHEQTVLLQSDRITAAGPAASVTVPPNTRVLPCRGRFLIPGLWDMHVHLSVSGPSALPVLFANGVLGVRDLGGSLPEIDAWRAAVGSGRMEGPRILRAGPMLNGRSFNQFQIPVENAPEARGAVRVLQKTGVDFVKVHAAIGREAYHAVADECRKLGLPFTGHLPRAIRPEEASDAGQVSIEHLGGLFDGVVVAGVEPEKVVDAILRFRAEKAAAVFEHWAKNGTCFTPMLVIERASIHLFSPVATPHDRFISAQARRATGDMMGKYKDTFTPAFVERLQRHLDASTPLVPMMQKAGVRLLTGTDMGSSLLVPGYSLHDELEMLAAAGLDPLQVLTAATQNPARLLGLDDLGSVQPGKRAELVLLDDDPLKDIRHTRKIRAVLSAGSFFDRPALDDLLRQAEASAKQPQR